MARWPRIIGVGILPARPYKPRDKAKVEAGVRFAQTYILGRLRAQTFFSLAEGNEAIAEVMRAHERALDAPPGREPARAVREDRTRHVDPAARAGTGSSRNGDCARVNLDYHIEVHGFLYSVPHALIRAEVEVRVTARALEVFHRGQAGRGSRSAATGGRKHGTEPEHMPSAHRRYAEWTPDRFRRWAGKIGPNTEGLISAVLASRPHPEQGFRTCLGDSALLSRPRSGPARSGLGQRARTRRPQ